MNFLKMLFKNKKEENISHLVEQPMEEQVQPYITEEIIFSREMTEFVNPSKEIRKKIVDEKGAILDFPGIEHPELIKQMLHEGSMDPYVEYRTEFHHQEDGSWMMIWQIQPDGRYWADEYGFGGENDAEIRLYTYLNENGKFTAPFRIYNVGVTEYFGTDREDRMETERQGRNNSIGFDESMSKILPVIRKAFAERKSKMSEKYGIKFDIAESQNMGILTIQPNCGSDSYLMLQVVRQGSDRAYTDFLKRGTIEEIYEYLENDDCEQELKEAMKRLSDSVDEYYV